MTGQTMTIVTDERCTGYAARGHPERPERVSRSADALREQKQLKLEWAAPLPLEDALILRAHTQSHLALVKKPDGDFDADTPAHAGIFDHARRSVGGALRVLRLAREGKPAFSLLRPPGHHAISNQAMGFCYLNSVAITALEAQAQGIERVAVYDFDVHHGNGTEAILQGRANTAFYSVHQHPCYPGTGTRHVGPNCFNYPVAPHTPREAYREVLSRALDELKKFRPGLVAVSAGFDAYAKDPLAQETLEAEDYHWIGAQLRALGIPIVSALEGGYSADLPKLILSYLRGLSGLGLG